MPPALATVTPVPASVDPTIPLHLYVLELETANEHLVEERDALAARVLALEEEKAAGLWAAGTKTKPARGSAPGAPKAARACACGR